MFILADPLGLKTWELKKVNNQVKRVIKYDKNEYHHLIEVIYCAVHDCYFALRHDNTMIVFF
jgi:hypothetical protein